LKIFSKTPKGLYELFGRCNDSRYNDYIGRCNDYRCNDYIYGYTKGTPFLLTVTKLKNVRHTGDLMVRLARRYYGDVAPQASMTWPDYFEFIKNIPYNRDPHNVEFLQRPLYTLMGNRPGGDCDDRAICVGAMAILRGEPFSFVAMGRYPDKPLHHVATNVMIEGKWRHIDPTYNGQVFGKYLFPPARQMVIGAWHG